MYHAEGFLLKGGSKIEKRIAIYAGLVSEENVDTMLAFKTENLQQLKIAYFCYCFIFMTTNLCS